MSVQNKRSIILLGHAGSGKTQLCEALLFRAGATTRKGAVLEGNTVSAYSWDEIERKNSINASFMFCNYQDRKIQIIDTPGYADFFGDVISCIRAVDNAVLVVNAASGVEVGTEKAWTLLEEHKLPRIIFINKTDKDGVELDNVVADVKSVLSKKAVLLGSSDSEELVEAVAEADDQLLEKYLARGKLSPEEITAGLHKAVAQAKVFPIISGSALTDAGIDELLKAIKDYLVSPEERPILEVEGELKFSVEAPFSTSRRWRRMSG